MTRQPFLLDVLTYEPLIDIELKSDIVPTRKTNSQRVVWLPAITITNNSKDNKLLWLRSATNVRTGHGFRHIINRQHTWSFYRLFIPDVYTIQFIGNNEPLHRIRISYPH